MKPVYLLTITMLLLVSETHAQMWSGTEMAIDDASLGGNSDYTAFYRRDPGADHSRLRLQIGDDPTGFFEIGYADWQTAAPGNWKNLVTFDVSGTISLTRTPTEKKKFDFGAYSYLESRNVGGDGSYAYNYGTALLRNAFIHDHSNNTYYNPNGYLQSQRVEMRAGNWYFDFRAAQNGTSGVWSETEWLNRLYIDGHTGNLGLGTSDPGGKRLYVKAQSPSDHMALIENKAASGYGLILSAANDPLRVGPMDTYDGRYLIVTTSGNVGIGTTNPDARLTVDGNIRCEEVKVEIIPGSGPDYVFEKDYNLPTLEEIKVYIDEHKHLPEVPSAKEMEEKGINVGEMNMILLKKVEELTLHLIEKEKRDKEQSQQIQLLLREIDQLKSHK